MRLLLTCIAAAALFAGCNNDSTTGRAPVAPPDALTIFYTCDTRGHLDPCNCPQGVAGGLARRSVYLQENAASPQLIVDAGNVTHGASPLELFELEYLLKGYAEMNYSAVNLGARELTVSPDELRRIAQAYPFLLSTNVRDANGAPIAPTHRTVDLANGYRVGILGVVDDNTPSDLVADGLHVVPPAEAIAQALPDLVANTDFIILLAYVNLDTMKALADRFFEIGVIIGGDVQQPSAEALTANRSLLVYTADKGKTIGKLEVGFAGGQPVPLHNDMTLLLEDQTGTPAIATLLEEFRIERTNKGYPVREDAEAEHTAITPIEGR